MVLVTTQYKAQGKIKGSLLLTKYKHASFMDYCRMVLHGLLQNGGSEGLEEFP
jgi:hypothetical protein